MKTENTMAMVLAAAVGALCSYCAQLVVPLAVLVAVMLADYITGMAKAWSAGELCSRTGVKGIVKKVGYLMVVGAAGAGLVAFLGALIAALHSGDRGAVQLSHRRHGHYLAHRQRADLHSGECGGHGRACAGVSV